MPFTGMTIGAKITETEGGARRIRVPEGDYLGEVKNVRPSREDYAGDDPFFSYDIYLADGPAGGVGKTYSHMGTWSESGVFSNGMVLKACGVNVESLVGKEFPTYAHFAALADAIKKACVGKKFVVSLADNTYNGNVTSRAVAFAPATDFVKVEQSASAPAVASNELDGLLAGSGLAL